MRIKTLGFIASLAMIVTTTSISCKHDPYVLPVDQRTGDPSICFERDVLPIFTTNCAKSGCHDGASHGEGAGWVLNNYDNIMLKGIVPGNPMASKVYEAMAGEGESKMPPKPNPALTQAQLDIVYKWIATGALNGTNCLSACDTGTYTYSGAVKPLMETYCIGCHYTGAHAVAGVILDNFNGVQAAATDSASLLGGIRHTSGYVAMPQGGGQLSDCQVTQIEKWIKNGMQND